jgi:hypothetical protein
MPSEEQTPVQGIQVLISEVRELKAHCQKIADNGMLLNAEIPKLWKRMHRLELFQAWFPSIAIVLAIVTRFFFLR